MKRLQKVTNCIKNSFKKLGDKGSVTLENIAAAATVTAMLAVVVTTTSGNAVEEFEVQGHLMNVRTLAKIAEAHVNSNNLTPALGSSSSFTIQDFIDAGKLSEAILDVSSKTDPQLSYSLTASRIIVNNVETVAGGVLRYFPVLASNDGTYEYIDESDSADPDRKEANKIEQDRVSIPANDSTGR